MSNGPEVFRSKGSADGASAANGRGKGATSLVRRQLDGLVRHLVDDVERLERPGLPRGLLLDDADPSSACQQPPHSKGGAPPARW